MAVGSSGGTRHSGSGRTKEESRWSCGVRGERGGCGLATSSAATAGTASRGEAVRVALSKGWIGPYEMTDAPDPT